MYEYNYVIVHPKPAAMG